MADALLSASLQALFDRLASSELINFIRLWDLSEELLNDLRRKLVVVLNVLNDAKTPKPAELIRCGTSSLLWLRLAPFATQSMESKEHFDLKAWIYVATQFLLLKVTKSFLTAIGCRHTKNDNLDLLQRQPKESLVNKNFLLVLDDVWDVESFDWESWGSLRTPLLGAAQGSKILVTSHDESVAKTMRAVCTHPLGELNPLHCWSLFEILHFKIETPTHALSLNP
ncbi:hypothetical protein AAG906_026499 [Vitis piasezkii]